MDMINVDQLKDLVANVRRKEGRVGTLFWLVTILIECVEKLKLYRIVVLSWPASGWSNPHPRVATLKALKQESIELELGKQKQLFEKVTEEA